MGGRLCRGVAGPSAMGMRQCARRSIRNLSRYGLFDSVSCNTKWSTYCIVKKVSSTEARQGSRGRPVLLILIAGLFLIVVGYFIVGAIGYSTQPDGDTLEPDSTRTTSEQTDSVVVSPQDSQTAD